MTDDQQIITCAMMIAERVHRGQVRKYGNLPYLVHPVEVMMMVEAEGITNPHVLAACLLHDTLEDGPANNWTEVQIASDILHLCGRETLNMVRDLTDVFTHEAYPTMNRATRKAYEHERLSHVLPHSKTIKIADCLNNMKSILANDDGFAKVFMEEVDSLQEKLVGGNVHLQLMLKKKVYEYFLPNERDIVQMDWRIQT